MSGFGMLRVDTPLGEVGFPLYPGTEATGSAVVDPDGTVKIHVIIDPHGPYRRRRVYQVIATESDSGGKILTVELLRDDGTLEL